MKRIVWSLLICLFFSAPIMAEELLDNNEEMSATQKILSNYREQGYDILGPIKYLGKTNNKIKLYRYPPLSYQHLDMKNVHGERSYVEKNSYVYALSKDGHVVLIRLDWVEGGEPNV